MPDSPLSARHFSLNERMLEELRVGSRATACDYSEVLPQLLTQIGLEADIYPSENYYYFSFNRAGSVFSGSLRLSSDRRDNGEVDYICYESYKDWVSKNDRIYVQQRLSAADGVIVKKLSKRSYLVNYGNTQTQFYLHQLDHHSPGAPLLPGDIRIGRSQDDSGATFELIFNTTINNFYFLLDKQYSAPDEYKQIAKNTSISKRTGFVYYHHEGSKRFVLVAVNRQQVESNSFYDGPFDHLPENDFDELGFWSYVYKAYPGMINSHSPGGEINGSDMIFSLRPYRLYGEIDQLQFIENCAEKNHAEINRISCLIWGEMSP